MPPRSHGNAIFEIGLPMKILLLLILMPIDLAWAEGIGAMAERVRGEIAGIAALLGTASFLFGLLMAMLAIWRFMAHGRDPMRYPLGDAIWRVTAAAMFLALPELLGVGVGTFFGQDATILDASGSGVSGSIGF
ncbi:MAG: hypothetical protein DBW67_07420 [SAR116 cluster bacterium]|nr:MAG: hypothetical protein DBW67_07420 [SAR116 cluster bacterium]HCJ61239.1 hypothetical protein [Alphaproteobacteria bacterium]